MMETQFESNKFYILVLSRIETACYNLFTLVVHFSIQCSIGYIMERWAIKNMAEAADTASIYY